MFKYNNEIDRKHCNRASHNASHNDSEANKHVAAKHVKLYYKRENTDRGVHLCTDDLK